MFRIAMILFSVLLFVGCATPEARIGKHPEIYAALPPDVQSVVKEGNIDVGFSTDAVYLALGHPDRQYQRTTDQGTATIWSFVARDYYTDQQRVTAEKVKASIDGSGKWGAPVVTEITEAPEFWPAERYHQDYLKGNPGGYSCHYLRD